MPVVVPVVNGGVRRVNVSLVRLVPWLFCLAVIAGCTAGVKVAESASADGWSMPERNSPIAQAIARSARLQRVPSVYGLCDSPAGCTRLAASGSAHMVHRVMELDDGLTLRVVVEGHTPEAPHSGVAVPIDPNVALPQLYGEVSGLEMLNGGTLWAGRRPAVAHIPSTGEQPGGIPAMSAGFERMRLFGPLRFNYTYAEAANTSLGVVPAYHHFRVVDIPANSDGTLQLGLTQIGGMTVEDDADATPRGWWLSAMHRQENVLAGTNRLALQRGRGGLPLPLATGEAVHGAGHDLERWRLANTLHWSVSRGLSGSLGAAMQIDRAGEDETRWSSVSARPVFALDHIFQVALQLAYDRLTSEAVTATRATFSIAPSWMFGRTQGNGMVQAYYTYVRLSDPLSPINFSGLSGDGPLSGAGPSFGVRLQRQW